MNKQEYVKLCEIVADLNVALCAMDDKQNEGFTNPKKSAKDKVLKAYLMLEKMIIKIDNYDNQ